MIKNGEGMLFQRVIEFPISDRYATPLLPRKVLTNVTELLKTAEKDRIISLFLNDKKYKAEELSDFEYFASVIALLPRMVGTREGEISEEELFILKGREFDLSYLQSDAFVLDLWQRGNCLLADCDGDYGNFLKKIRVEKLYNREPVYPSFFSVEKYKKSEVDLSLLCDARTLSFVRPDPYHARLVEEKNARGESLDLGECSLLCAQAFYRLAESAEAQTWEIRLRADGDGKTAAGLLSYFRKLGVRGRVWIVADGEMTVDAIAGLCQTSDADLTVRPEIVLGSKDSRRNAMERLGALAAIYPMSLWHFGGVPTTSPLFAAGHLHMRRVICDLSEQTTDSPLTALRIAQGIFCE